MIDSSAKLSQNRLPIDGLKLSRDLFIPPSAIHSPHPRVISGIRFKTELHDRLVLLLVLIEKLRKPSSFADDDNVFGAIKTGALGYLLKDTAPHEVLRAIREVARGEASLHPTIARKLIRELNQPAVLPPTDEPLTDREVEVLRRVAQGLSNQEIADALGISILTVKTHVANILAKLGLPTRIAVAGYVHRHGLVQ